MGGRTEAPARSLADRVIDARVAYTEAAGQFLAMYPLQKQTEDGAHAYDVLWSEMQEARDILLDLERQLSEAQALPNTTSRGGPGL